MKSGIISTGVHVRARAIRLTTVAVAAPPVVPVVVEAKGAP